MATPQDEIRRLHAVCRTKNAALKELIIISRQLMIYIKNNQPLDDDMLAQATQAIHDAEDMLS